MKRASTVIGLTLASLFVTTAQAARLRDPVVDHRQLNQQERIHEGAQSGAMTRSERRQLQGEQRAIRGEERAYKADGKLTPDERADLRRDLRSASRDIYQEKQDGETRGATADPGVNQRQRWQRDRIRSGVRNGTLTPDEAKSLRSETQVVRQEERQYKSDGAMTAAERKDLHQDLNQTSKEIYNDKHN